jgi:hypothetical protein
MAMTNRARGGADTFDAGSGSGTFYGDAHLISGFTVGATFGRHGL